MLGNDLRRGATYLASVALCFAVSPTPTAFALSAELAKKCRDMALQAYPYQLPGTGPGNAANQIGFYKNCIAKNGDVMAPPKPADRH